jgi:hypothetical protein
MSWIGWVVIGILAFNALFFGVLGVVAVWTTWRRSNQ